MTQHVRLHSVNDVSGHPTCDKTSTMHVDQNTIVASDMHVRESGNNTGQSLSRPTVTTAGHKTMQGK